MIFGGTSTTFEVARYAVSLTKKLLGQLGVRESRTIVATVNVCDVHLYIWWFLNYNLHPQFIYTADKLSEIISKCIILRVMNCICGLTNVIPVPFIA